MRFDKNFSECSQDETDYKMSIDVFSMHFLWGSLFVQSWLHSERFLSDSVEFIEVLISVWKQYVLEIKKT